MVAGAALHLAIQLPGLFKERMRYTPSFDWRDQLLGDCFFQLESLGARWHRESRDYRAHLVDVFDDDPRVVDRGAVFQHEHRNLP